MNWTSAWSGANPSRPPEGRTRTLEIYTQVPDKATPAAFKRLSDELVQRGAE